jgi:hypothetical protein
MRRAGVYFRIKYYLIGIIARERHTQNILISTPTLNGKMVTVGGVYGEKQFSRGTEVGVSL